MIQLIPPYFKHTDERGSIIGIINNGEWRELNIITSDSGVIRGNHFHKTIRELFIIIEGEIEVHLQKVIDNQLCENEYILMVKAGDVFIVEPMINHIFIPKRHSRWINALSHPVNPNCPDINRIFLI